MTSGAAELAALIRWAFGDVPFPAHYGYHAALAMDDGVSSDPEELRRITRTKDRRCHWWELTESDLPLISNQMSELSEQQKASCRGTLSFLLSHVAPNDSWSKGEIEEILGHEYWKVRH